MADIQKENIADNQDQIQQESSDPPFGGELRVEPSEVSSGPNGKAAPADHNDDSETWIIELEEADENQEQASANNSATIDLTKSSLPGPDSLPAPSPTKKSRPGIRAWLGRPGINPASTNAYIKADALYSMLKHAMSTTKREVGGFLIGEIHSDDAGEFILVNGSLKAMHTQELQASLTFTHETWQQIYADQAEKFPGTAIVGWYHTHPGYGIFLSEHDEYIHRNFFSAPHQIAFVIDPIAKTNGVFRLVGQHMMPDEGIPVTGDRETARKAFELLGRVKSREKDRVSHHNRSPQRELPPVYKRPSERGRISHNLEGESVEVVIRQFRREMNKNVTTFKKEADKIIESLALSLDKLQKDNSPSLKNRKKNSSSDKSGS